MATLVSYLARDVDDVRPVLVPADDGENIHSSFVRTLFNVTGTAGGAGIKRVAPLLLYLGLPSLGNNGAGRWYLLL